MPNEHSQPLTKAIQNEICHDKEEERQIERAKFGDSSAIDWLLARYRLRVVRLATHILRRPSEAEDVAQEAFVTAFRNLNDYRGEGRFYTWLYQIVVRRCLERRRLAFWSREEPLELCANSHASSNSEMEALESRVQIETLLNRLKPPMRAMLALRELEGLEYEEIAEMLQIPVGRVKWRLHQARAQFRELWQAAQKEREDV